MYLHPILHRQPTQHGSCSQFPSPAPLQTFSEPVKLKSLEGKETEDCIPPRMQGWQGRSVHRALALWQPWVLPSMLQGFMNQPWPLLSPHCCWVPLKETFLMLRGRAAQMRDTQTGMLSPNLLWAKEEKLRSWRACNYHVLCPTLAFSRENSLFVHQLAFWIYWLAPGPCHMAHCKSATNTASFIYTSKASVDSSCLLISPVPLQETSPVGTLSPLPWLLSEALSSLWLLPKRGNFVWGRSQRITTRWEAESLWEHARFLCAELTSPLTKRCCLRSLLQLVLLTQSHGFQIVLPLPHLQWLMEGCLRLLTFSLHRAT